MLGSVVNTNKERVIDDVIFSEELRVLPQNIDDALSVFMANLKDFFFV